MEKKKIGPLLIIISSMLFTADAYELYITYLIRLSAVSQICMIIQEVELTIHYIIRDLYL